MISPWQEPLGTNAHLKIVRLHQLERQQAETLARIARETDSALPERTNSRPAGDPWKLRGIPIVGVPGALGGAIRDTNPGAFLRSDRPLRYPD